ncbi:hypothetical protein ATEIFO6365_0014036100 [Aspergillus terreus]|uniref:Uncharacterized protein n=1 Tax=Aspergillus terreus TaxID=33178 RepID=A0A8H3RFH0_ASPTE|nr:hypothetical protein ATEIFO6365_0014036100 [Aspergillus terreus]
MSSSDALSNENLVNQLLNNDNNQLQDLAEESNLAGFDVTEILFWKGVYDALETGDTSRGESFSTIVLRIHTATNSGDTQYVNPFADRSKWDKADYLTRCLTGLVAANTQNIEGLFYRKNVPLERKEKIISKRSTGPSRKRRTHAKNKKLAPTDPVDAPTRTPLPGRSMLATASEAETPKTDPAEAATDKLPAKDELPDEADEKTLTPFKLLIATAQTYSIYQPTGQEIDTLTLAYYTAETIADAHAEPVAIYVLAQFRENPLLLGCILADMDDVPLQLNPFNLPADHEHAKLILSREAIRRFILGGSHELVGPDNVVRGLRLHTQARCRTLVPQLLKKAMETENSVFARKAQAAD